MKLYPTYYENDPDEYEYSVHYTQQVAEVTARVIMLQGQDKYGDASDPDLSCAELVEWLAEEESYATGTMKRGGKP